MNPVDTTTTPVAGSTYPFPARCPFQLPAELDELRRTAPVSQVRLATGATGYLVTSHELVRVVLSDERFSRRPVRERAVRAQQPAPAGRPREGGFDFGMSIADPADHARWRRLTAQVLNVRHAESMRARIGALVDELIEDMAALPRPVDLMSAFAYRLPLRVLWELFEVPADLRPAYEDWAAMLRGSGASMAGFGAAMGSLHASAAELVRRQRAEPGDGLLARLMSTRFDGAQLSDEELVSTVLLLTVAGYETVAVQLGNGFLALFQHPDELALLRDGTVAVDTAVEEILRYAQASTGFAGISYTTGDVALGGVTIPAGSAVFISIDAAGRDEAFVDDPDTFALSRGSARSHLVFGAGAHFCLGAPLARVELQESVARLLARFPALALVPAPAEVSIAGNRFNRFPRELPVTW